MSRPQKSNREKLLEGTYRADRNGDCHAEVGEPEAPAWLDAEAAAEWKRVTSQLVEMGLLARIDRAVLAAYCTHCSNFARATEALNDEGLVITGPKGCAIPNPLVGIQERAASGVRHFSALLGLNPANRQRMKSTVQPELDEFDLLPRRN